MFIPALKRARRRNRTRLITSHQSVRSGEAIDNALFYVERLQENVSAARRSSANRDAILNIALESCLPATVEGADFERMYHRRNLEAIIERGLFATAS